MLIEKRRILVPGDGITWIDRALAATSINEAPLTFDIVRESVLDLSGSKRRGQKNAGVSRASVQIRNSKKCRCCKGFRLVQDRAAAAGQTIPSASTLLRDAVGIGQRKHRACIR